MGRRYLECSVCGDWNQVRPLYARTYGSHAKDGRFARAAWICDPCFAKLTGWDPTKGPWAP